MAKNSGLPTTQRAYTFRLKGPGSQENLWKTHEAVNKGAKAFGDWLLTMRGGLDHNLADTKDKRIVLALSWLSVESGKGAPAEYFVKNDLDTKIDKRSNWKTVEALRVILESRRVPKDDIQSWVNDCEASLSAVIRYDAVWVNRSKAFDELSNGQDKSKARKDAQTMLWFLLSDDYMVLPKKAQKGKKKEANSSDEEEELEEEKQNAAIKSGKGAGQRTRHPFSHIFGFKEDSQGFGKGKQKLNLKDYWKQHLEPCINYCGVLLSDTKQKKKGEVSPTELHREMFSKAASRLAQIHTKQKQQEVEREQRMTADEELKKLENDTAYNNTLAKLKEYCGRYEESSGSLRGFQIQPRQISKWEAVIEAWGKITETDTDKAEEKRKEEAKRLQEELRDEKFGDINLFIRLAEEEYKPVWWHKNKADASILRTFVRGMKARADAEFLKVAAYRHPDPYFHPVFCQFGVSRPAIEFNRLDPSANEDVRIVRMLTWDGARADRYQYLAVSKRFDAEIGSICESTYKGSTKPLVSRRDRLNLSVIGGDKENVCVAHVFDPKDVRKRKKDDESVNTDSEKANKKEPEWNGTLQADRRELERIGNQTDKSKAENLREKLKWWLIVSMELQLQLHGPWVDYVNGAKDSTPFERTVRNDVEKGQKRKTETKYISLNGWPHEEVNKPLREKLKEGEKPSLVLDSKNERKGHARLILSRLPDLRLLSVDLGHRHAAACAVWETLSKKDFDKECATAGTKGSKNDVNELYATVKYPEQKSKKATQKAIREGKDGFQPTTFYRRVGPDILPDGTPHPAPWARLDRQFLVKLQGEKEDARKASPAEIEAVSRLDKELGRGVTEEHSLKVDELMSETVRTLRLALRRHGDRARIAYNLTAAKKLLSGGREEDLTEEGQVVLLTDILATWHGLFTAKNWTDERAKVKWDEYIKSLLDGVELTQAEEDGVATSRERKKQREELYKKLEPIAEKLAQNEPLRMKLHVAWGSQWREDDEALKKNLRWLRDWILPRGKRAKDRGIRNVGGLSLTRIATIKSLYQVQKAYRMRPEPDDLRKNIPAKGDDSMQNFGQGILDTMERMRENRVKQLASRIAEAALGIGIEQDRVNKKDPERPRERINSPRFAPCHAVVIENLTHYRPEETRTRRENRQLMDWSAAKVKKYLTEACELNGLHLREVQAGYTSRQDSRTGAPGMRCSDIPVAEFVRQGGYLSKRIKNAQENVEKGKFVREAYIRWDDNNKNWRDADGVTWTLGKDGKWIERNGKALDPKQSHAPKPVRIPQRGGEIFVSADKNSPASKGLQADLNAAANIGLKALLDPDWQGKWWYVPCDSKEFKPVADKVKGSAMFQDITPLKKTDNQRDSEPTGKKKKTKKDKTKDIVNLWRDPSTAKIANSEWKVTPEYWNQVQSRVMENLRQQAKLEPDDIPF